MGKIAAIAPPRAINRKQAYSHATGLQVICLSGQDFPCLILLMTGGSFTAADKAEDEMAMQVDAPASQIYRCGMKQIPIIVPRKKMDSADWFPSNFL